MFGDISLPLIISSFFAGIVMFLAPCTLPLVPAVLSFVSGVSLEDGTSFKKYRRRVVVHTLLFVFGFSLVFIILGGLAAQLGSFIDRVLLTRIAGVVLIAFGILMIGLRLPLVSNDLTLKLPQFLRKPGKFSAFLLGLVFGVGWTPCAGPVVGTILTVAAIEGGFKGVFLLTIFSLGLAIPFAITAYFLGSIGPLLQMISRYTKYVYMFSGVLLILFGILLATNNFGLLLTWGFSLLRFLNYEELLKRFI